MEFDKFKTEVLAIFKQQEDGIIDEEECLFKITDLVDSYMADSIGIE